MTEKQTTPAADQEAERRGFDRGYAEAYNALENTLLAARDALATIESSASRAKQQINAAGAAHEPPSARTSESTTIELKTMPLQHGDLSRAKRLLGFDYGDNVYHVLCFDWGDDGGAIGIWREGDDFCARITLDALVEFNQQAKKEHTH